MAGESTGAVVEREMSAALGQDYRGRGHEHQRGTRRPRRRAEEILKRARSRCSRLVEETQAGLAEARKRLDALPARARVHSRFHAITDDSKLTLNPSSLVVLNALAQGRVGASVTVMKDAAAL